MTHDPAQIAETVARHDEQIDGLVKSMGSLSETVNGFDAKLDQITSRVAAAAGASGRVNTNTMIAALGVAVALAGLGYPLIEDVRSDGRENSSRNEARIGRLEEAHAIEVARNNVVEYRQGRTSMIEDLFLTGKLRLEAP